jgi:hypothetical protein
MQVAPTSAIYFRIPVSLRNRLEVAAQADRGYRYRGALADTAIRVIEAGLDALFPATKDAPKAKSSKKRSRK